MGEINREKLAEALGVEWVPMPGERIWFNRSKQSWPVEVFSVRISKDNWWIDGTMEFDHLGVIMQAKNCFKTREAAEEALGDE